ncbi:MAG TPA: DNA replication and repair protein RecF [Chitinophagaceae bacterium]|nr:DNA replication and repair protein RecF [Chitinophagaceae bacterium]
MLALKHISLYNFKNYGNQSFDFDKRVIGIYGNNGAGKTNLLDAIHYLCFTRSYFSRQDNQHVHHGGDGFRIEGQIAYYGKEEKAVCIFRETGKKEFLVNGAAYDKFSLHIGRYPCVVIAPDDSALITGDSRERRAFTDELLSQLNQDYLQQLIIYKKVLEQRNSLLRSFGESGRTDFSLLEVLDEQLVRSGVQLFEKRREFMIDFLPLVKHFYQDIARKNEEPALLYESDLIQTPMKELLAINRQKDCLAQRTTAGAHKDDIDIRLGDMPFKNIASQGQRKSLLFSMKLAEMELLKKEKHFAPLLLLDDVFEKLDEDRISNLLHKVCVENDGQVFITDTHRERLELHLQQLNVPFQLIGL